MRNPDMNNELNQLHDTATANYTAGCRSPVQILGEADLVNLAKNGLSAQFLYDVVDDFARYGEPVKAVFLELAQMRADYFRNVLGSMPAEKNVEEKELPPKSAEFQGVPWLPRIIRKAQCFREGSLCDDIMYGCAGDRAFLKRYNVSLPSFLSLVASTQGDPARILRSLTDSSR